MLNELALAVRGLKKANIQFGVRHPRIQPAANNRRVFVVQLNSNGKPSAWLVISKEDSSRLYRFLQSAADQASPAFPCFNLPIPLRRLRQTQNQDISDVVGKLVVLQKKRTVPTADLARAGASLLKFSEARAFSDRDTERFRRSAEELPRELVGLLAAAGSDLVNFKRLVDILSATSLTLTGFAKDVSRLLATTQGESSREDVLFFQEVVFGSLDWRNRQSPIGSTAYLAEKTENDKGRLAVFYLDLAEATPAEPGVAHPKTWDRLSATLEVSDTHKNNAEEVQGDDRDALRQGVDAFTGEYCALETGFSPPKLARLGPFKPFSLNTTEWKCLLRYGLHKNASFPVAKQLARDFYNRPVAQLAPQLSNPRSWGAR
ncbi:MAG: hypothetical protein HYZ73_05530 [Elusimicrobia bacterium]|nr:hypothetical protein [Elusimicrobiota bacterium]